MRLTFDKNAVEKLLKDLKPKYKDRAGGFTKINKIGQRAGDAASMVYIKLT
jgi:large subunit ribosomal protein L17